MTRASVTFLSLAISFFIANLSIGQDTEQRSDTPPEPEYHETLKPLAPFVGHWRSERLGGAGELKAIRNDTYSWIHDGRAMRLEWTEEDPDGNLKVSASYIFYFDGAERKIKFVGTGGYGIVEGGTLASEGEDGLMWDVYFIFANGNQGRFKFRTQVKGNDKLSLGWSKISGTGPNEMGPYEYERVK